MLARISGSCSLRTYVNPNLGIIGLQFTTIHEEPSGKRKSQKLQWSWLFLRSLNSSKQLSCWYLKRQFEPICYEFATNLLVTACFPKASGMLRPLCSPSFFFSAGGIDDLSCCLKWLLESFFPRAEQPVAVRLLSPQWLHPLSQHLNCPWPLDLTLIFFKKRCFTCAPFVFLLLSLY